MRRHSPRDGDPHRALNVLQVVVALNAVSVLVLLTPAIRETPLRYVFGLLFLLVLPGYALVSVLFPAAKIDSSGNLAIEGSNGQDLFLPHDLDGIQRLALSVATSIVIVSIVVFALDQSTVAAGTTQIVISVGSVTMTLSILGLVRQRRLPHAEGFLVPVRRYFISARDELVSPETTLDVALNVILIVCLILAAMGAVYGGIIASQPSESTEFHLLVENESGQVLAEGYPSSAAEFEETTVLVGVDNHEGETINYSVVVLRQQVEREGNSATIVDQRELTRYSKSILSGEGVQFRHEPKPDSLGGASRVVYLLYRGAPPENPNETNAYQDLHLWLDEEDEDAERTSSEPNVQRPLARVSLPSGADRGAQLPERVQRVAGGPTRGHTWGTDIDSRS